jgi:hypothetical protein
MRTFMEGQILREKGGRTSLGLSDLSFVVADS